jgi:hypothetical protein
MHKAQCKFGNLWQLQIQLMAKALVEMASLKTRAAKLGADEFMCKLIQYIVAVSLVCFLVHFSGLIFGWNCAAL